MKERQAESSDAEDKLAMEQLRDGDDLALNEIMDRWTPRLGSYLTRMLGHEADVGDLLQETFVAVYRSRMRYRPKAKFSTWLFGIASNLARQKLRWRSRHPELSYDINLDEVKESPLNKEIEKNPIHNIIDEERAMKVRSAILSLPDDLRNAIILSQYEELPYMQIAKILKCSVKAVETRVYRSKALLRKRLEEEIKNL